MGTKKETLLQQRIQKLIESRGGYITKNWGSMVSEPGVADLTACYKGLYLAIEVKVDKNKPSPAQGVHARLVHRANGITAVVWSIEEVETILDTIDFCLKGWPILGMLSDISCQLDAGNIDNGTRY